MFYDERIENTKGKISKRAVVISLVVSAIIGGIHIWNIIRNSSDNRYMWLAVLDIGVFVGALLCLAVGAAVGKVKDKDERTEAEQNGFYNKAAVILIKLVISLFAFLMPIALYIGKSSELMDMGVGGIIYVLLFIVGIYVVHSFRRNDIYFNYSIIDSERYYLGVFKNIGKSALYALAFLGISLVSLTALTLIKSVETNVFISILLYCLAYCIGAFAEISIIYLLYSFLEKSSSVSVSGSLSKSTHISLWITVFIYALYTAAVIYVDSMPIHQARAVQIVSLMSSFDIYIKLALLMFITYFEYEYQKKRRNKLLSIGCMTVILSEALSVLAENAVGGLKFVFMPEIMSGEAYYVNRIFSSSNVLITDLSAIACAVGFSIIIFALIKNGIVSKAHVCSFIVFAVLIGAEIFLRTQTDIIRVNVYRFACEVTVLCYFAVIALRVSRAEGKKR